MSGVEVVVGVISCVAAVVSAYQNGTEIVEAIKAKRRRRNAAPPTKYLEESLIAGSQMVEAEKEHGLSYYGSHFEKGDDIAIHQLKDIIIELQASLLTHLRSAQDDDLMTDFTVVIDTSETGRRKTLTALFDLYTRLAEVEPIRNVFHRGTVPVTVKRGSSQRQIENERRHTYDIEYSSILERVSEDIDESDSIPREAVERNGQSNRGIENTTSAVVVPNNQSIDGIRRQSLWSTLLHRHRAPSISNSADINQGHRTYSEHSKLPSQVERRNSEQMAQRHYQSGSAAATQQEVDYGHLASPIEDWIPTTDTRHQELFVNPWVVQDMKPNTVQSNPGSAPMEQEVSSDGSQSSGFRRPSYPSSLISLPSAENDFGGFCEGAWKMQVGWKHAMKLKKEEGPVGVGYRMYWKCCNTKCTFEGNAHLISDPFVDHKPSFSPRKKTYEYDTRIWTRHGIRFRWAFLAKSHVSQTRSRNHTFSYRCIFCCADGKPVEVFGNIDTLMRHIAEDHTDYVPSEIIGHQFKCLVAAELPDHGNWDIILPRPTDELMEIGSGSVTAFPVDSEGHW